MDAVAARGNVRAASERDFTVKVDAVISARPNVLTTRSTPARTLADWTDEDAAGGRRREVRLALLCCSNYPSGFSTCIAASPTALISTRSCVGDYIYEFENGRYGDGAGLLRIPEPRREAVSLSDYRIRYATYRADPDLQEAHRQHPFIAVWDDHELTNDAWSGGASNHNRSRAKATGRRARPRRIARTSNGCLYAKHRVRASTCIRSFRFGSLLD